MNWLTYFQKNRDNRPSVPWETGVNVPPHLRKRFVHSLQKFQIGESGEGRHLRRLSAATGDKDYAAAMELFVREEQRHGALMAQVLKGLNAPLLTSDWTDNCFVFMRHLSGLHTELLVVLTPEMIAKVYFNALWRGFSNPVLESVFGQIVADEEGHLAFHADYLNSVFSKMPFGRRFSCNWRGDWFFAPCAWWSTAITVRSCGASGCPRVDFGANAGRSSMRWRQRFSRRHMSCSGHRCYFTERRVSAPGEAQIEGFSAEKNTRSSSAPVRTIANTHWKPRPVTLLKRRLSVYAEGG